MIQFVVGNTNTSIYGADSWVLGCLDLEMRYPTAVAEAHEDQNQRRWRPPDKKPEWDGWIRLLHRPKTMQPYFPTGLLALAERICRKMEIPYVVEDARQRPEEGLPEFPSGKLIDRDYQLEAEEKALAVGRGVLNMPPRSGKTRTAMSIVAKLGLPAIWVAPTDAIVQQTVRAFESFFGPHFAHHQVGASETELAQHSRVIVCTAATAVRLSPEVYNTREVLVVDEWHHCFSGATQILTTTGTRRIDQIQAGDLVWSRGLTGLEVRPVSQVWVRPSPPTIRRIKSTVGEFRVTGEHEIFTPSGKVKAKNLRTGSPILVLKMPAGYCCARGEENRDRSGRQQPPESEGCGRAERSVALGQWVVCPSCAVNWRREGYTVAVGEVLEVTDEPTRGPEVSVYDLEVAENHNYFAEGVLVSNSAAKTYREIMKLCDHIYYRYGLTGTFFRSGDDELAMHALLSNEIYRVGSGQLLEMGYLLPTHAVYIPCDAPRLQCPKKYREDGSEVKRVAPWLKYGVQEHTYRNQICAYAAAYLHNILSRKVLVLVSTKSQGRILERMIAAQIPEKVSGAEFNPVEFLSTDRRRSTQQKILKAFNESDEVRVLVGTSLVGEGVDLPPADALVYARGGKAEVELAQNSFRVCTAWGAKRDAVIVDFADRHNKNLMKHSRQRLEAFYREPIMSVEVLPSIKYFAAWCKNHAERVASLE